MTDYLEQETTADVLWAVLRRCGDWAAGEAEIQPVRQEEDTPPLMAAVRTSERTALALYSAGTAAATPLPDADSGGNVWAELAHENRAGEFAPLPVRAGSGDTPDLLRYAQEVDGVFRRDMRRYDGGFFLY